MTRLRILLVLNLGGFTLALVDQTYLLPYLFAMFALDQLLLMHERSRR